MTDLIFLKLGGSLLTDKTGVEALRVDILSRVADEIAAARAAAPSLRLVLGHGSGSFGHVAAARHGTRAGVGSAGQWAGFAEVCDAAARLNRHVVAALLAAGVPAIGLPPSSSAVVADGRIIRMATTPIAAALAAGIVPVVFGDVAFDTIRGGTIVSTEEVMEYLSGVLQPSWLLLAGETAGVFDIDGTLIPQLTIDNLPAYLPALGGSRGTDVTGGMAAKVRAMLELTQAHDGLGIRIFSGLQEGLLGRLLIDPSFSVGTLLS